jgi:hypothetical protein
MEKILIKDAEQWGWWELASKTMGADPATVFPCSNCDESVIAKDAMHSGWVRLALVGDAEPESEPKTVEGGTFYCPACQVKLGIDIEEGYAKRPAAEKDQSNRRGRGGRRNNSRRDVPSGSGKAAAGKDKNNRTEPNTADAEKKSNDGNGPERSGSRRGNGSRNRGRRSRRPRSKGSNPSGANPGPTPKGTEGSGPAGGSE